MSSFWVKLIQDEADTFKSWSLGRLGHPGITCTLSFPTCPSKFDQNSPAELWLCVTFFPLMVPGFEKNLQFLGLSRDHMIYGEPWLCLVTVHL